MAHQSKMQRTKLGQHLQRQGIDLRTLAAQMGYTHGYLWRLCIGDRKPSAREQVAIPDLLGLTALDLFGDGSILSPLALVSEDDLRQVLRLIREDNTALWLLSQTLSRVGELMQADKELSR